MLIVLNLAFPAQSQGLLSTDSQSVSTVPTPSVLKIAPVNPPVELSLEPPVSKLKATKFAEPEVQSRSAPRAFKATAYSLRGRTASGVQTQPGIVAADPAVLPLGSIVEIKAGNYSGVYTVRDTGSRVKGNLVDVWMPSTKEALRFGRRTIKLQVLRYGPSKKVKK